MSVYPRTFLQFLDHLRDQGRITQKEYDDMKSTNYDKDESLKKIESKPLSLSSLKDSNS